MPKLVDSLNEYATVMLPGFGKLTIGESLQDLDFVELERVVTSFYGDRLALVEDVEPVIVSAPAPVPAPAIAIEPEPEPEPEPAIESTPDVIAPIKPKRK